MQKQRVNKITKLKENSLKHTHTKQRRGCVNAQPLLLYIIMYKLSSCG